MYDAYDGPELNALQVLERIRDHFKRNGVNTAITQYDVNMPMCPRALAWYWTGGGQCLLPPIPGGMPLEIVQTIIPEEVRHASTMGLLEEPEGVRKEALRALDRAVPEWCTEHLAWCWFVAGTRPPTGDFRHAGMVAEKYGENISMGMLATMEDIAPGAPDWCYEMTREPRKVATRWAEWAIEDHLSREFAGIDLGSLA